MGFRAQGLGHREAGLGIIPRQFIGASNESENGTWMGSCYLGFRFDTAPSQ